MNMIERMNPNHRDLKKSGIRMFTQMAANTPGCISLTLGEPDFDTDEKIKTAVKTALDNNMTHYSPNNGYEQLRVAIADWEKGKNRLFYDPDEVIVTVGATEALADSLASIIEEGDEVIVPVPAFSLYDSIISMYGGTTVKMDTSKDSFQITKENLEHHLTDKTKAIILNSPNNPTGTVYTDDTLEALHNFLIDKAVFVICDDVYNQLEFTGNYKSFVEFADMRDRIILIQSFSKTYAMTGFRAGYIMADKPVKEIIERAHQFHVVSIPSFIQMACIEALSIDSNEMRETYRRRRNYVYGRLIDMGLEVVKPEGGLYIFPSIEKFGTTSYDFCRELIEEGLLALTPGIYFDKEGYVRISFCYEDSILEEGMNRLEKFVTKKGL